jgi:hypothetical protein
MLGKIPKYHTNILLGELGAKIGTEDIFKPTIRNENLHQISNDYGLRLVNFATSKNLRAKSIKSKRIQNTNKLLLRIQLQTH